jgi:hypothetical protein
MSKAAAKRTRASASNKVNEPASSMDDILDIVSMPDSLTCTGLFILGRRAVVGIE